MPDPWQESELLDARRQLAEAEGALSVSEDAEAALMAVREDARAARQQHEVTLYKLEKLFQAVYALFVISRT